MSPATKKELQKVIEKIVRDIPKNHAFDSHFVINQLHTDKKYSYMSIRIGSPGCTVAAVNSEISRMVKTLRGTVEQLRLPKNGKPLKSWSETIHGDPGECACWLKLN